jgi:hypothetical protein
MNRNFGGLYHLHFQDRKSAEQETSVQLVVGDCRASHLGRWENKSYNYLGPKNAVFWGIFIPATMTNIFWDITPCGSS